MFSLVVELCIGSALDADTFYWYDVNRSQTDDFNGCFNEEAHWFKGATVGSSCLTVNRGTSGMMPDGTANTDVFQFRTGWYVTFPADWRQVRP